MSDHRLMAVSFTTALALAPMCAQGQELPVFDPDLGFEVQAELFQGKWLVKSGERQFACRLSSRSFAVVTEDCLPVLNERTAIALETAIEAVPLEAMLTTYRDYKCFVDYTKAGVEDAFYSRMDEVAAENLAVFGMSFPTTEAEIETFYGPAWDALEGILIFDPDARTETLLGVCERDAARAAVIDVFQQNGCTISGDALETIENEIKARTDEILQNENQMPLGSEIERDRHVFRYVLDQMVNSGTLVVDEGVPQAQLADC